MQEDKSYTKEIFLIGVGVSSGGIEALSAFMAGFPAGLENFSIIVAHHVNPAPKNSLDKVFSNKNYTVVMAKDGAVLCKKTIYIAPPNFNIAVSDKRICLTKPGKGQKEQSFNDFFKSIAEEAKEKAIAVVLSGSGKDGAEGIKEVKANGGFAIAQEPGTATFSMMPLAAIETDMVDEVLAPERIGDEIKVIIYEAQKKETLTAFFPSQTADSLNSLVKDALSDAFAHPYVVLNYAADIIRVNGDLSPYFTLSEGNNSGGILRTINRELQLELKTLINAVKKNGQTCASQLLQFSFSNLKHFVRLVVKPLSGLEKGNGLLIVIFEKQDHEVLNGHDTLMSKNAVENHRLKELENELAATKEQLRLLSKELESNKEEFETDIIDLKTSESAIKISEERYRFLFNDNPLPMLVFNTNTLRFIEVNDAAILKYGYSREEFMKMKASKLEPQQEVNTFLNNLKKHKKRKAPHSLSALHKKKDGSIIHVELTCNYFKYNGKPSALILANDVTDKVKTEAKLISKNEEFNKILDSITDGFFAVDKLWTVTYWNPESSGKLRSRHSEVVGMNLWEIFPDLKFREEYKRALRENTSVHFQEYYSGLKIWLDISVYPFGDGLSVFYKDITQKKRIEKLESLGRTVLEMNAIPESQLEETVTFYLSEIEKIHEGLHFSLMLLNRDQLENLAAPNLPEPFLNAVDGLKIGPDSGACGAAAYYGKDVIITDIKNDVHCQRFSEYFPILDFNACWAYPVIGTNQKVLGTFSIFSKEGKAPSDDEKNTMEIAKNILLLILENKLSELAVRRSNERYDLVAKATHDTIWDWDLQSNIVYRTYSSFNQLFGYRKTDLKKNRQLWLECLHPSDKKKVLDKLNEVLEDTSCEYWEDEFRFRKASGEYAYVNEKGYIKRNENGEVVRMIGATQDITPRKLVEEELLKLSLIARETENVVIITNLKGEIIWVNEAFQKVTGYCFEEIKGQSPGSFLHGEETNLATINYIRNQVNKEEPFECEILNYNKAREKYWIKIQAQPIKNDRGEAQFYFAIETDITRKKEEEHQLKLLESVITNTNDAIVITELNGKKKDGPVIVYANPQFLEITGSNAEKVIGHKFLKLQEKHRGKSFINSLRKIINEGKIYEGEVKYSREGKEVIFEMHLFPIKNDEGVIRHYVCIQKDITRAKKMKFYLQMAFKQLQFHIENTTLATVQWDNNLKIRSWSNQAEQILGYKKNEVLDKGISQINLVHEDDFIEVKERFTEVLAGKENTSLDFTTKVLTKEGTILYTEWHNSILFDEDGEFLSFLTLIRNITTTKLAEKAMIEGQEQERKRIAREIHDGIGQMMIAIKYKIASFDFEDKDHHDQMIEELEELVSQTIDEVRLVSYNLAPRSLEEIGMEAAVRNLCEQTQKLTGLKIVFQYIGGSANVERNVLNTMFRITQEALNNVIKHARATYVKINISQSVKSLTLSYEDDGTGFIVDKRLSIKGNGLKNMQERASMLNGRFQINSTIGKGTNIFVTLPLKYTEEEVHK